MPNLGGQKQDRCLQNGQDLARKGKYEAAIQAFSDALTQKNVNISDILDSRSAVYCKMGLYDQALSDAKRMIKSDNQNERGYLRAAKALLLIQKPDKALDVYAYALKTLDKNHPQREALEKIHFKLSSKMASQYRDPVKILNNDCLLQIFEYIPFKQRVKMTRVSKTWKAYIRGQPSLWTDISFKGSRPFASVESVKMCILYSLKKLRRAQIHDVKNPISALQQVSQYPKLEHLDIDGAISEENILTLFRQKHTLKTLILSNKITMSETTVDELLRLPNLEHFEANCQIKRSADPGKVGTVANLKTLALSLAQKTARQDMRNIFLPFWFRDALPEVCSVPFNWDVPSNLMFGRVPKLEELRLSSMKATEQLAVRLTLICHPNLRVLDLCTLLLIGILKLPEKLESLRIINCSWDANEDLSLTLPNLKSLVLYQLDWFDGSHLSRILAHNSGALETLQIELCDEFKSADLQVLRDFPDAIKNLKSLHLHGMRLYNLTDNDLIDLLQKMPLLKELHIPNTKVTGFLIKKVVQWRNQSSTAVSVASASATSENSSADKVPEIHVLNLKGCMEVSYEALEWGRANGLKIIR